MTGPRAWLLALGALWAALATVAVVAAVRAVGGPTHPEVYSEAQAREGLIVFAQHCASCHGADLAGGAAAPALVGNAFWEGWDGRPVAELYAYVQSKMPLGRGGSLSRDAYLAATATVLWANALPAGERPLEPDSRERLTREAQVERPARIAPAVPGRPALLGRWTTSSADRPDARLVAAQPAGDPASTPETGDAQAAPATGDAQSAPEDDAQTAPESGAAQSAPETEDEAPPAPAQEDATETDTPAAERTGAQEDGAPDDLEDAIAGVVLDGPRLYRENCRACHGAEGAGGFGPPLAGNPRLEDAPWAIRRVLLGGRGMPSFHRTLVPAEVAYVVSHVRTSFGNDYGSVEAETVRDVRARLEPTLPGVLGAGLAEAPLGEQRYTQLCSACHGLEGGGDVGPPLAGNPALQSDQLVITRILFGAGLMPAFAHHSDAEIAAIASYIRTAWSNAYAPVAAEQVAAFRPDATDEGNPDAGTRSEDGDAQ